MDIKFMLIKCVLVFYKMLYQYVYLNIYALVLSLIFANDVTIMLSSTILV